jgi:hypothetical protein
MILSPWTTFKDYGWRLLPSFAHMFHDRDPVMVREHFMPVGLPSDKQEHASIPEMDCEDVDQMGAYEMSRFAELSESNDIFLRGRTEDGTYIQVDLERDNITPTEIIVSWDFDSLIWVTQRPRFKCAVSVYATPQIRNKAPISKHNHVYVDLLAPPSTNDRESGTLRSEWWERRFRLSQIPHTWFGKLGDGSGTLNLYIFFPRMTHQHEYTRRWVNVIPSHVQERFWEKVVQPAMLEVTNPSTHPYVGLSQTQHEFKRASPGKRQDNTTKAPAYPFRTEMFLEMTDYMVEQVRKDFAKRKTAMF